MVLWVYSLRFRLTAFAIKFQVHGLKGPNAHGLRFVWWTKWHLLLAWCGDRCACSGAGTMFDLDPQLCGEYMFTRLVAPLRDRNMCATHENGSLAIAHPTTDPKP